ncbi:hypothetical protein [Micromonospora sp. NBC_01412]|uniref:hypothetical protein n=1 Tax=Micromonospora sp. NBC_01412 TaxID=2903590 RepID=UPI0032543D33
MAGPGPDPGHRLDLGFAMVTGAPLELMFQTHHRGWSSARFTTTTGTTGTPAQ